MDYVIGSPIIVYIPAIGCANWEFEAEVEHGSSVSVDRGVKLVIAEARGMTVCFVVVSIETLRSHSDSINRRFILFSVCVKFLYVGIERLSPTIVY